MGDIINTNTFEIRYKPNPKALDYRGAWAEVISEHLQLPRWRILENRLDVYNEQTGERAFVGFRNAGYVVHNSQTDNYFADKIIKFVKFLVTLNGFEKEPFIERIGVRSIYCKKYKESFEKLKNLYLERYMNLTDAAKKLLDATILDIGGHVNFADKHGNFNTMSGPMEQKQMNQFFDQEYIGDLPDIGLFFDIDYWLTPKKQMGPGDISSHINDFSEAARERFEQMASHIMEVKNG
ncbi:MAG: hypothetical protein ABIE74_10440 [Pseudomonadota bacterium]